MSPVCLLFEFVSEPITYHPSLPPRIKTSRTLMAVCTHLPNEAGVVVLRDREVIEEALSCEILQTMKDILVCLLLY